MPTISENFAAALTAAQREASIEERFRLTDKAWTANNPVGIDLEDVAENKRILLGMYEGMARAGHLGAMRACACIYFTGEADQQVTETERPAEPGAKHMQSGIDIRIRSNPDYGKALQWCERAANAGSEWAQGALPHMQKIAGADAAPKAGL